MDESIRPVWAEINLNFLESNMRQIKKLVKDKKIYAVVKADGYGHGALDVAPVFLENGATGLAVAVITEALELRRSGVKAPILILGYTPITFGDKMAQYDIEQTVYDLNYVKELSEIAKKEKRDIKIHIALDTGMGRIGILPNEEGLEIVREISKLPNIILEGIFTHFATADETDKSYAKYQLKLFNDFTNRLEQEGIKFNVKHVSNSAAIMDMEETYFDGVRPGIIMYGYYPSEEVFKDKLNLRPALTLKTSIAHLKTLPEGMYISYGRKFKTERESIIATLPIGYADGYTRALSNKGKVIINGKLAPIVGRVCMDQVMVDVTDVGEVSVGDEVVLLGEQGEAKFNADDLAEILNTINYEIICMIGRRVPRVYMKDGKIVKIRNYV